MPIPAARIAIAGCLICLASCKVSDTVVSRTNSDLPQQGRHLSRQGKTHWSYFWGILSNDPWPAGCQEGSDMSRVRVTTNPGFIIVSFLSLGIVVPQRLEWDCAQAVREPGVIGR
jgi:hypothetical protein